jgi:CMP-N-acetylneuraminic acid synthetase
MSRAIEAFLTEGEHDSLMSVTERHVRMYDSQSRPMNHDPDQLLRTQDLPPVYEENSNIYIAPRQLVLSTGKRIGPHPLLFPMSRAEAMDIDDAFDFEVVDCLLGRRRG